MESSVPARGTGLLTCEWCDNEYKGRKGLGRHQATCRRNPSLASLQAKKMVAYRGDLRRVGRHLGLDPEYAPTRRAYQKLGRYRVRDIMREATPPGAAPAWGRAVHALGFKKLNWVHYDEDGQVTKAGPIQVRDIITDLNRVIHHLADQQRPNSPTKEVVLAFPSVPEYSKYGRYHYKTAIRWLAPEHDQTWNGVGRRMGFVVRDERAGISQDLLLHDYCTLTDMIGRDPTPAEFKGAVSYDPRSPVRRWFGSFQDLKASAEDARSG